MTDKALEAALPGESEVVAWYWLGRAEGHAFPVWARQANRPAEAPEDAEPLVTLASYQAMQARAEAAEIENDRLIADAQAAWSKHGGTEIALGQWKARAEAAERERDEFEAKWIAADEGEKLNAEFLAAADKRAEAAEARVKEMEEALKPFAAITEIPALGCVTKDMVITARTALTGGSNG